MIVVRLHGGLGNQMFQYAYGRALRRLTSAEVRYDDSSYASDPLRGYALGAWRVDAPRLDAADRLRLPKRYDGLGWKAWLRGRRPFGKLSERPLGFSPRFLRPRDNAYLVGYWQDERFFAAAADEFRDAFQPASPLTATTTETVRQIEATNAVAVHVRRTDYLGLPEMQVCDADYYQRCLGELLSEESGVTAFVFSDDPAWCREHLRLACPTRYVDHTTGATAHEDLWMMSRCRHHVIPNSSFSWWAAWLKTDTSGQTFAPTPWFNNRAAPGDGIVPTRWRVTPGRLDLPWVARAA